MPWAQLNVGFIRRNGDALPSARAVFGELEPVVARLKEQGVLHRFYFMRKPPDVRFRFEAAAPEQTVLPVIEASLSRLRESVAAMFRSVYEPEAGLFGGPEAMDLVHAYFDVDTQAWMTMDRLAIAAQRTINKAELLSAALDDAYCRVLDDPAQVWDVWCNMRRLIGSEPDPASIPTSVSSLGALMLPPAAAGEVRVLISYDAANRGLADGLQRLWRSGSLECGLRALLAQLGIFVFNRHGLNPPLKSAVAEGMCRLRDPARALIGGEADAASAT